MNIKSIIKSQSLRHKILRCFRLLPDKIMLPMQYYLILHRWPGLKNPQRFTEWIQVYKMNYRNKDLPKCVDKYTVREYVSKKFGNCQILNQLYQVCDRAEDINWDTLPQKFVVKTTNGGNGDNVLIVKNKLILNIDETVNCVNSWLKKDYSSVSREWAYIEATKHPRIIVESLLECRGSEKTLDDYKFLCFNGKFRCLWVDKGRYTNHHRGFWDEKLNFMSEVESDHPTFSSAPALPSNISEMVTVAETLSTGFPFVRVDLYNVDGKIYFGEMTFYPWSGYVSFKPVVFDFALGKYFRDWRK